MKFKIYIIFIFLLITGFIFFAWQFKKKLDIEVAYDNAISTLPITTLKNLRYLTDEEKNELFQLFSRQFPVNAVKKKIGDSICNPQIVLWFTDHFGQISRKNILWYKENILEQLGLFQNTFWLIDLTAWRFLSVKEADLLKCSDFQLFLKKQEQDSLSNIVECPLITDIAAVLDIPVDISSYAILRSKDFFIWLSKLPFTIDTIDPLIADLLIRKDLRSGAARFSLRQLGYKPQFLDTWSEKLQQNLLDIDNTQLFPLLQYLEGIYYALKIVERFMQTNNDECNIVFLLPNKEFTYYMIPGEMKLFETFKRNISSFILKQNSLQLVPKIKIYFYPFNYGKGFYDQPFEELGESISNKELIDVLKFKTQKTKEII